MKTRGLVIILILAVGLMVVGRTPAMSPFKKAFDEKYVKKSGDKEFVSAFKKMGCNTCHVKKKSKDWLNDYGQQLAKLIPGHAKKRLDEAKKQNTDVYKAEQAKLVKELEAAFAKAEKLKTPEGGTYAELFKSHKLPTDAKAKSLKEISE